MALVAMLLLLNAPPRSLVLPGPQQVVHTVNPKMGVHTRLSDEVEPWKIKRTLEMVRGMGAPWIVEYFPWAYVEPHKGIYDWTHADQVMEHARAQGLTVIARIDYVPQWARPRDTTSRYLDPEHYGDYAAFVARFAARYGEDLHHIVVWNEPNLAFEWGYRVPDPAAYVALLSETYSATKQTAPDVLVLAAGLAPTMAPLGSEWGMDDLLYLQSMYDQGLADVCDGLAAHAYGFTFPADDPPAPDAVNLRRVELLREIMVVNGDSEKPVFITEGGWNDHPRWTKAVSPYERIANTVRAYELAQESWPWCEAVCIWAFRFPWPQRTYQDRFAFVTPEFEPKAIYTELVHLSRGEPFDYLEAP